MVGDTVAEVSATGELKVGSLDVHGKGGRSPSDECALLKYIPGAGGRSGVGVITAAWFSSLALFWVEQLAFTFVRRIFTHWILHFNAIACTGSQHDPRPVTRACVGCAGPIYCPVDKCRRRHRRVRSEVCSSEGAPSIRVDHSTRIKVIQA
jgi:hypothetical protein